MGRRGNDVSRAEGGNLRVDAKPVSLFAIAQEAAESFESASRGRNMTILVEGEDTLAMADERRISQVVFNFISNALKFTPEGGEIRLIVGREGSEAFLRVRDNGVGLTESQISRLFQPFSQVHDTVRTNVGGSGLGLYIAKGIVQGHNGRAWCESDGPGLGTTFCIALPRPADDASAATNSPTET